MSLKAARASGTDDYDFIIRIIQYLERQFNIHFFISSKDFDVLYRWFEKRIPETVIRESLCHVVERRRLQNKPIASFALFSHDVRVRYRSFLSMDLGKERAVPQEEHAEIKRFLKQFPAALLFMRNDFARLAAEFIQNGSAASGPVFEKLLHHFQADVELNAKCEWFLNNLSPHLRHPEIEKKYRLNYLLHKFGIPTFS